MLLRRTGFASLPESQRQKTNAWSTLYRFEVPTQALFGLVGKRKNPPNQKAKKPPVYSQVKQKEKAFALPLPSGLAYPSPFLPPIPPQYPPKNPPSKPPHPANVCLNRGGYLGGRIRGIMGKLAPRRFAPRTRKRQKKGKDKRQKTKDKRKKNKRLQDKRKRFACASQKLSGVRAKPSHLKPKPSSFLPLLGGAFGRLTVGGLMTRKRKKGKVRLPCSLIRRTTPKPHPER